MTQVYYTKKTSALQLKNQRQCAFFDEEAAYPAWCFTTLTRQRLET